MTLFSAEEDLYQGRSGWNFPESDFWPTEWFNIQAKVVFLKTDCLRLVRHSGWITSSY